MKVIRFKEAKSYEPDKDWKRICLCDQDDISIEYFEKPPGHCSPMHNHVNAQVMIVIKGKMKIFSEGKSEIILKEGDAVYFSGSEKHAIKNCSKKKSVGIDIFVPGRSFDFWTKRKKDKK